MQLFHAFILSLVEGLTEFLPISSTGHMVLAARLLSLPETEFVKSFEIIIQLGAILAVALLYGKTLLQKKSVWMRVLIAFLPTAIVGFFLYKLIKHYLLGNELVTVVALLVGGIILIIIELLHKEKDHHVHAIEELSYRNAFFIGLGQSLSVIPGVSRAAATIVTGMLLGTKRKAAVEFSFLLAVPTMLAASGLDLVKTKMAFSPDQLLMLMVGFVTAFVVAYVTVKYFLQFIQRHTFIPFGIYRIVLAITFWVIILR